MICKHSILKKPHFFLLLILTACSPRGGIIGAQGEFEKEAAKYTFHGWRHFFTSYMIRKLDKKLLKGETGHKTDIMLAHCGDHETAGDRETIQLTKKEIFAGLLPETENTVINSNVIKPQNSQQVLLLEYKGDPKTAVA
jgi:hypothetical protein